MMMAWERINACGPYYHRARKVAGRVVREYVCPGEIGERAAQEDARQRAEREAEAGRLRTAEAEAREVQGAFALLDAWADALKAEALEGVGYVRRRGEWRRPRHGEWIADGRGGRRFSSACRIRDWSIRIISARTTTRSDSETYGRR